MTLVALEEIGVPFELRLVKPPRRRAGGGGGGFLAMYDVEAGEVAATVDRLLTDRSPMSPDASVVVV